MNFEEVLRIRTLKGGWCYDLATQLSHYSFSFLFLYGLTAQGKSVGKYHGVMSHDGVT